MSTDLLLLASASGGSAFEPIIWECTVGIERYQMAFNVLGAGIPFDSINGDPTASITLGSAEPPLGQDNGGLIAYRVTYIPLIGGLSYATFAPTVPYDDSFDGLAIYVNGTRGELQYDDLDVPTGVYFMVGNFTVPDTVGAKFTVEIPGEMYV